MDVAQTFAATFVDELAAQGVEYACVSPGSRSAPIAMALQRHPKIKVIVQIDERSSAFFAVGLGKVTGKPAVVLCTSGTAAAELHAAVVEASYSSTPLIVITADRPPELQDVGANQSIDQQRLYGTAVRWYFDPGVPVEIPAAPRIWRRLAARAVAEAFSGPVHINLPFREPLVPPPGQVPGPGPVCTGRCGPDDHIGAHPAHAGPACDPRFRPAALAPPAGSGGGDARRRAARTGADAARIPSPGRAGLAAPPRRDRRRGRVVRSIAARRLVAGARTGSRHPPRRDSDVARAELLARRCLAADFSHRPGPYVAGPGPPGPSCRRVRSAGSAGKKAGAAISATLISTPVHEGHVVRALASRLPESAQVFIGSSMPIRAADSFWPLSKPQQRFFGNRGASGIDGLVSTGLGVATGRSAVPTVLLLGDLSVYHDMNGLWAISRHGIKATVVVCDNNGGGVFNFLPQAQHPDVFEEIFATPLGLDFAQVARLYGLVYSPVTERSGLEPAISDAIEKAAPTMVVVRFKRDDSVSGHRLCWEAAAAALRS